MNGKIPNEVAIVSLALVKNARQIQADLGDIRLSDVVEVLFKFAITVLNLQESSVRELRRF